MKHLGLTVIVLALGTGSALAQVDTASAAKGRTYSFTSQEGWLGMGLSCSRCSFQRSGRYGGRWTFSELPSVFSVDANGPADRAGIRTGDTLVSINGLSLASREGGEAFGRIVTGQGMVLRYRRDGREPDTRLVAGVRPYREAAEQAALLRELARAQARQQAEAERAWERQRANLERAKQQSQSALGRQREYMRRAMEQVQRAEGQLTDSARSAALQRVELMLDSAVSRWRAAESLYAQAPVPAAIAGVGPIASVAPRAAVAPVAAIASVAPVVPLTYAQHREFGPLRFTGTLGNTVIEARSPWAASATEVTDSEIVVTSRDLSVRVAIRPAPAPAPAPMPRPSATPRPKAAPSPRPARPAHPPGN